LISTILNKIYIYIYRLVIAFNIYFFVFLYLAAASVDHVSPDEDRVPLLLVSSLIFS